MKHVICGIKLFPAVFAFLGSYICFDGADVYDDTPMKVVGIAMATLGGMIVLNAGLTYLPDEEETIENDNEKTDMSKRLPKRLTK